MPHTIVCSLILLEILYMGVFKENNGGKNNEI